MFAQTANLLAMLFMSGAKKTAACKKFDIFESQLGPVGIAQLVQCGGDFDAARNLALDFCGSTSALNSTVDTHADNEHTCNEAMCNVAKTRVRLFVS